MPETRQWNGGDKTRIGGEIDMNNEDPGVNSDDEDDMVHLPHHLKETQHLYCFRLRDFPTTALINPLMHKSQILQKVKLEA